jgi:hypothetical protein
MELFEKASRLGLRFDTERGQITVEDLWHLPLTSNRGPSLDGIAMGLHEQLERHKTISFVDDNKNPDERLQLAFDVVLHIIKVRKEENQARLVAKSKAEQKQRLLEALANRENTELTNKSADELRQMIEALD